MATNPQGSPTSDMKEADRLTSNYKICMTEYRAVSDRLQSAIAAQSISRSAFEAARDRYEDERRGLILDGVPGLQERCSAERREAALARALEPQTLLMRGARDQLRLADAALESAQVAERTEREALRSLQLSVAL